MLRRWLPLLAVVALLTAAGAAASMSALPLMRDEHSLAEPGVLEQRERLKLPSQKQEVAAVPIPPWVMPVIITLGVVVAVVLLMVLLGAVVHTSSRFRQRSIRVRAPAKAEPDVGQQVMAALDAGLAELDETDADPRRAVIACWVRLENAASAAGIRRRPGDTSTDLVLRLLAGHKDHLSEAVLTRFADAYRQARYASHDVDETMREQAKAALGRLRDELTGVPV